MRTYPRALPSPARGPAETADGAMLRAIGVITLVGIGAVHFLQIVPTVEATPLLGAAYVVFITACLLVAARLLTTADDRAWAAAGAVCVAALGGYAFTRVLSTPFDNQDVGNWACMLGMAALFVEGLMMVLSAYVLVRGPSREALAATADPAARRQAARGQADREVG